jgi:hypothetical protein
MYLENKLPLPIYSNPGMVFPRQHFKDEDAELRQALLFFQIMANNLFLIFLDLQPGSYLAFWTIS